VGRPEVAAKGKALARPSGHRRRLKTSMPRWRFVSGSANLVLSCTDQSFVKDYTTSSAAPAAAAATA
jgi:hypothetical protein